MKLLLEVGSHSHNLPWGHQRALLEGMSSGQGMLSPTDRFAWHTVDMPALMVPAPARAEPVLLAEQHGPQWARHLAARSGILEVMNAEMLRSHSHPLLSKDHMVPPWI